MENIINKAKKWLDESFDAETRKEVQRMIDNDHALLTESFYKDLEFGTGGLRGIMGVGSNRMNKYTVGMATQGLSNYLIKNFPNTKIKCAIAFDCRNNSDYFAKISASVLSANGIKVYLFESLRPTPELSFAIRHLQCHSGIVITASHNPKEYNGYKVYWQDGGQIINPHDIGIINEVRNIKDLSQVKFDDNLKNVEIIGEDIDNAYINKLSELILNPEDIKKSNLKIVFTPIHGSTVDILPKALRKVGFTDINIVEEQAIPDGNFPTVASPNPEEASALSMAIEKAKKIKADIVMGTDPDGDRLGIVVRQKNGEYLLLNGNQTASILIYYLLEEWQKKGKLKGKEYIVKTIVTTELLSVIANHYNVKSYDVLTGFKYIAEIIEKNYGKTTFIGGGEESYGFLAGEFVRDKDAVMSCMIMAEVAAWAKNRNITLDKLLIDIYIKFGYYLEGLKSLTKTGKSGLEEIQKMMEKFRNQMPKSINGIDIALVHDFEKRISIDKRNNSKHEINLPKSNVLQFELVDGTKITIRPSGTEPKIKFYVSVHDVLKNKEEYPQITKELQAKIDKIIETITNF
ncbi:MAG: phospho-sugar mutase [Bacteroidota bacterium]|jgi:phosphoglucomutase|nr:phospho-sugar mutase [Bacteroidota bacterium]NLP19188.1 phospho-sugar mutase [Bacteroidales bacterium]HNY43992.1 phospho-sugar mutase [Bacteroidales bacterium]